MQKRTSKTTYRCLTLSEAVCLSVYCTVVQLLAPERWRLIRFVLEPVLAYTPTLQEHGGTPTAKFTAIITGAYGIVITANNILGLGILN